MKDGLGIASRPVAVTARLEPRAQSGVIIDLAVVSDPDRLVLVCHRLMPAGHVHDRQPPMAQPYRPLHPEPLTVRPPVAQNVAHALHARLLHGLPQVQADDAGDAAHGRATRALRRTWVRRT